MLGPCLNLRSKKRSNLKFWFKSVDFHRAVHPEVCKQLSRQFQLAAPPPPQLSQYASEVRCYKLQQSVSVDSCSDGRLYASPQFYDHQHQQQHQAAWCGKLAWSSCCWRSVPSRWPVIIIRHSGTRWSSIESIRRTCTSTTSNTKSMNWSTTSANSAGPSHPGMSVCLRHAWATMKVNPVNDLKYS